MRSTAAPALRGCASSPPPENLEGKRPPPPPRIESRQRDVAPSPVFRLDDGMTVEQAEEAGLVPADGEPKSPQGGTS